MCNSALYLTVLAACLAGCSARPADILARVPSSFYYGTKWVLFRDNSIPDPPPNVIQHENNVQVLATYPQHHQPQQQQVFQGYVEPVHVTPAPVHVTPAPVHVTPSPVYVQEVPTHIQTAPVLGDFDSEVIESKSAHPTPAPVFKVTSYSVTSVPSTSVHVEGPAYYLRKKKNAAL